MRFDYRDNFYDYGKFMRTPAVGCLCKHVCTDASEKARRLAQAASAVDNKIWWGYKEGLWENPDLNRVVQLSRVQRFICDGFIHPVRVIIDHDGDIIPDNLHTVLAHILCRNSSTWLQAMPVYFVDLRDDIPKIIDGYNIVDLSRENVRHILMKSEERCRRMFYEVKDIGYTIGDFIADNGITRDAMTLPSPDFYTGFLEKMDSYLLRHYDEHKI